MNSTTLRRFSVILVNKKYEDTKQRARKLEQSTNPREPSTRTKNRLKK